MLKAIVCRQGASVIRISKPPEERRAELIAAARRLFDKKGVDKTRVSDIVREVGVAQGVFYYYFASKAEMVSEVIRQVSSEIEAGMAKTLADSALDFSQKTAAFLHLYLDVADQFTADEEYAPAPPEAAAPGMPLPWLPLLQTWLTALLEQGVKYGEISLRYPQETAQVLIYGLRPYMFRAPPDHALVYALAEQVLGLPHNAVARHARPYSTKKTYGKQRGNTKY